MFFKAVDKKDIVTGKKYQYYKLCESYRIGKKTRHRTILCAGKLEEVKTSEQRKLLSDRIEQLLSGEQSFFNVTLMPDIERLAVHFYKRIKKKVSVKQKESLQREDTVTDYQEVDLASVMMEDAREIGCEWLCKQAIEELEIDTYLKQCGWADEQISNALIDIISKATYPASEKQNRTMDTYKFSGNRII